MTLARAILQDRPRDATRRRAALASSKNLRTKREWCPVLNLSPRGRYGVTGEQKHLPDTNTPRQHRQHGRNALRDEWNAFKKGSE